MRGRDDPVLVRLYDHELYLFPLFQLEEGAQHGVVVVCRRHHLHPFAQETEYAEVERLGAVLGERDGEVAFGRAERGEQKTPAILDLHRGVESVAVTAPAAVGGVRQVIHESLGDPFGFETGSRRIVKIDHAFLRDKICAYVRKRACPRRMPDRNNTNQVQRRRFPPEPRHSPC